MLKTVLAISFIIFSFYAASQMSAPAKAKPLPEQTLDGTAEVFLHLGGKLMGELKTRLNMDTDESKKSTETVKVIYDFGLFKIERDEKQPIKKP